MGRKVKICGLSRRKDAFHAAGAGADYLGVVLVEGSPRYQTLNQARSLFEGVQGQTDFKRNRFKHTDT